MRYELGLYVTWYNELRPHQTLDGRTPQEIYDGILPPQTHYETRGKTEFTCRRRVKFKLSVSYFKACQALRMGRKHLPIVSLQKVA
jgi:hypothetical protein